MELLGVLFELKIKSQQKRYIWTNVYVFNLVFYVLHIEFGVFFHLPMGETRVWLDAK